MTGRDDASRLRDRIHRFWMFPVDPFVLGLFRIGVGLVLLWYLAALAPWWIEYYQTGGTSLNPARGPVDLGYPFPLLFVDLFHFVAPCSV